MTQQTLILAGRYEVGEVIGWGGMAQVHRGRDQRSDRPVAIKLLRRGLALDPLFRSRLRREGRTLSGLHHPTIVTVYDTGSAVVDNSSAGSVRVPFIVMEYVAGRTLRALLQEGRLTLEASVRHQLGVLSALEISHRAGIVHRDIKPANVMITPEGRVKVVDFGIARAAADPAATVTDTHAILGTPPYLSPEQVRGETANDRSDLYSAGCLLYELLTGRPPFVGADPVSVAYQHVHEEPTRVSSHNPEVTPALDVVLVRALAKAPKDRFPSARAFREALQSAAKSICHAEPDMHLEKLETAGSTQRCA